MGNVILIYIAHSPDLAKVLQMGTAKGRGKAAHPAPFPARLCLGATLIIVAPKHKASTDGPARIIALI